MTDDNRIDPKENMDRLPWLRLLPDFNKLPTGAKVAMVVVLVAIALTMLGVCEPRVVDSAKTLVGGGSQ